MGDRIVSSARSWIGTPYVLGARVKGSGCDCATLIAEVLIECGIAGREELEVYSHDWFCNSTKETYMLRLLRHARKVLDTVAFGTVALSPGNIVLTRAAGSKLFNHGGIFVGNNRLVHAFNPSVAEVNITQHHMWEHQPISIFEAVGR